jgi:hypothetical protein
MEKNRGCLPESSEIEPIEHEMYFALEKPLLDEILQTDRDGGPKRLFAMDYLRPTDDGNAEVVGMVISDREINDSSVMRASYDVTLLRYNGKGQHVLENRDSIAYVITETNRGTICRTDAMYADGMCIARHPMNAVEHTMLIDELLAIRSWQLASQCEHDILSR